MIEILVALVSAVGLVVVALISNRTRQHAKAARAQVENSHDTNLREEADERHKQNVELLNALASDIRGLRRDIGRHTDHITRHEERLDELERTQPTPPRKRR